MEPEEIQTKLFELGELFGNSLVAGQSGDTSKTEEFKAATESILAEFAAIGAHIRILCEKQYLMPGGRLNKCREEELLLRCHGGEISMWLKIGIILDGTTGHPEARLGDIDTHFDLDYDEDECDDDVDNDDTTGEADAADSDKNPSASDSEKKESDTEFLRRHGIMPPDSNT